jgi:hypothetical protein
MNETVILVLAGSAGVLLGVFFFGGLWWTVRRGLSSKRPALCFSAASCCERAFPGRILCCLRRSLGAAAGVSPRIRHRRASS